MPRPGGLPRSPPPCATTPASTSSVYDANTVIMDTPFLTIKRRKPDFASSDCDNALVSAVAELTTLVKSLLSDNRVLKNELAEIKQQLHSVLGTNVINNNRPRPVSYASVAANANKVLIINPVSETDNPEATRKIIKSKLKPSEYNTCGVSSTKKGGVIVQCPTSAEREKLKTDATAQLGDQFVVSAPIKMRPRVRFFGFSEQYNAIDLVKIIREQNTEIFSSQSYVSVAHIFKAKSIPRYGAKLELDAVTFKKIIDAGKIFVEWDQCDVSEDINIRRCFKCWGFNHVSSKCVSMQRCPKCCGNHNQSECVSSIVKCAVCTDAVSSNHLKIDTNHTVFSTSCPSYVHRVSLQRSRIDYGL